MKLNTKKWIFVFLLVVIAILSLIYFKLYYYNSKVDVNCSSEVKKSLEEGRYSGFGPSNDTQLIACYGIITEESWTDAENSYSLYDHKNKYEAVLLDGQGHYNIDGDSLFVVVNDTRPKDLPGYGVWYFVDGKERLFTYKLYDDIPKYIAIDIYSGEVTIYPNNLEEIPEKERYIFQELEAKSQE